MPTRKTERKPPNPPKGLVRVIARLLPEQVEILQEEAVARMKARGRRQLDVAEVIREAVAAWIAKRK